MQLGSFMSIRWGSPPKNFKLFLSFTLKKPVLERNIQTELSVFCINMKIWKINIDCFKKSIKTL